ncbi:uncharacterized protein AAES06_009232 [Glossophaga mutica]
MGAQTTRRGILRQSSVLGALCPRGPWLTQPVDLAKSQLLSTLQRPLECSPPGDKGLDILMLTLAKLPQIQLNNDLQPMVCWRWLLTTPETIVKHPGISSDKAQRLVWKRKRQRFQAKKPCTASQPKG